MELCGVTQLKWPSGNPRGIGGLTTRGFSEFFMAFVGRKSKKKNRKIHGASLIKLD